MKYYIDYEDSKTLYDGVYDESEFDSYEDAELLKIGKVYRVVAAEEFDNIYGGHIKVGTKGGYVADKYILNQKDKSWIDEGVLVGSGVRITDDSYITGKVSISGPTFICNSYLKGEICINGNEHTPLEYEERMEYSISIEDTYIFNDVTILGYDVYIYDALLDGSILIDSHVKIHEGVKLVGYFVIKTPKSGVPIVIEAGKYICLTFSRYDSFLIFKNDYDNKVYVSFIFEPTEINEFLDELKYWEINTDNMVDAVKAGKTYLGIE